MKYEKLIYIVSAVIIAISATMNILQIPFGNTLFVAGVLGLLIFQNIHLKKLKIRIRELEERQRPEE